MDQGHSFHESQAIGHVRRIAVRIYDGVEILFFNLSRNQFDEGNRMILMLKDSYLHFVSNRRLVLPWRKKLQDSMLFADFICYDRSRIYTRAFS